jgi:hypothetical protein
MNNFDLAPYRPIHLADLVRIGKKNDGGYVIPTLAINSSTSILSLGVNLDWSFEKSFVNLRPGLNILCVDGTTGVGKAFKKAFQKVFDFIGHMLTFQVKKAKDDLRFLIIPFAFVIFFSKYPLLKMMVGNDARNGYIDLYLLMTKHFSTERKVFLKMDIEGGEYEVLPIHPSLIESIAGMVVEFHLIDKNWSAFQSIMSALMQDYFIAHIHGNNFDGYIPGYAIPKTLEISFVRKDLLESEPIYKETSYPIQGLDMPCNPKYADLIIKFT